MRRVVLRPSQPPARLCTKISVSLTYRNNIYNRSLFCLTSLFTFSFFVKAGFLNLWVAISGWPGRCFGKTVIIGSRLLGHISRLSFSVKIYLITTSAAEACGY